MKVLIRIIGTILVAGILLFAGALLIPRAAGITPYVVMSGSMSPTINAGDVCYIDSALLRPTAGQVAAYQIGDVIVTHRVEFEKDGTYIMKGDANETEDLSPVAAEQIVGTVVAHLPKLGYPVVWLNSTVGIVITLSVLLTYYAVSRTLMRA